MVLKQLVESCYCWTGGQWDYWLSGDCDRRKKGSQQQQQQLAAWNQRRLELCAPTEIVRSSPSVFSFFSFFIVSEICSLKSAAQYSGSSSSRKNYWFEWLSNLSSSSVCQTYPQVLQFLCSGVPINGLTVSGQPIRTPLKYVSVDIHEGTSLE